MLTYKGGNKVRNGTYWNMRKGLRVDVSEEEVLPGDAAATYLKMSPAAMLLAGPVMGLAYAILMPVIGIGTVLFLGVKGILRGMSTLAAKSISFEWSPGNAYLSGKKKKGKKDAR